MHQPAYRDLYNGNYQLPWTYLHVIKDYVDMAAHLEAVPQARAVVNFAPTLLEQIDDYAQQVQAFLREGTAIGDPVLAALDADPPYIPFLNHLQTTHVAHSKATDHHPLAAARLELIHACFKSE
jgi:alpha-amylase/alpha-mannosidase (GH57 family)